MEVIPAIDLRGGLCVRLHQGDYSRETVYSADPLAVAKEWEQAGAPRIHVVDLDGARTGQQANGEAISAIADALNIPLQVGGGIRDLTQAQALLRQGVGRVVLGTAAIINPNLVRRLCESEGSDRIVIAVDARDGRVAIRGWEEVTSVDALELIAQMSDMGATRILYTDISRDGTLTEPNFQAIGNVLKHTHMAVLASGGVTSIDHLIYLAELGAEGAILGRALYTGDLDLAGAIEALAG